jgi:polar amino acid transport system substrate-binding protein
VTRLLGFIVLVVLAVVFAYAVFGNRDLAESGNATLDLVRNEGMARAGYSDAAPLAYDDASRGLTGEAPEIARVILQRMGVGRVEGVLTPPDDLVPELYQRRFEFIANGMPITPARCQELLFSEPTHAVGEAFLVRKGNPLDLHSYEDLAKKRDAHVGIVTGSPQHKYAIAAGVPAGSIRLLTASGAGVASLLSGVIDAYASDALSIQQIVDQSGSNTQVERALPFTGPTIDGHEVKQYGAFAFRKADKGLLREFNGILKQYIGTPEHLALVRRFGITAADLPAEGVTAKGLCEHGNPGPPQQLAATR